MRPRHLMLGCVAAVAVVLALTAPDEAGDVASPEAQPRLVLRPSFDLIQPVRAQGALPAALPVTADAGPVPLRMSGDFPADTRANARRPTPAGAPGGVRLEALSVPRDIGEAQELFEARSWYVPPPPPPPAPPAPPPEPVAPPLPFRFVGRLDDGGGAVTYFVNNGASLLALKAGDMVDGVYRLDSADGRYMHFIYLPLKTRQSLSIGAGP
jgi:hypothetical protein